jgi:group II intron reverse transcriptase/maturase
MQTTESVLSAIQKYGSEGKPVERLYRQLFKRELYLTAYGKIYANQGAMTRGADNQTVDGMSIARIDRLIEKLKSETFRWTPVRRTYIPKKDGSKRPLGIPNWEDKLLQEVMRMLLEAYYEPQFSDNSHGFRPEKGCHTALQDIYYTWKGTKWFIEGDISKCFDSFNHNKLIEILERSIDDGRFITLIRRLLQAGYLENWKWNATLSGTPQGGIISPLLANIYLNELDKFVERELLPEYNIGVERQKNLEYVRYEWHKGQAKKNNDREAYKAWGKLQHSVPSLDTHDPSYRRLRYIRYADDFLLGFVGEKSEAEDIKEKMAEWIGDDLKLELSKVKTVITHSSTAAARFLGYDISTSSTDKYRDQLGKRNLNGHISLEIPQDKLTELLGRYMKHGKATHRAELLRDSDYDIVTKYQAEYRGYVQYYIMASNLRNMQKLHWYMSTSMLKTLANKHKSSVMKMATKYRCTIQTKQGEMKGYRVTVEREGKKPLIAEFGGLHLIPNRKAKIVDEVNKKVWSLRTQIVQRLLADTCEMCGNTEQVEVHHIRKLADINTKGRKERPLWTQVMIAYRRKTLVVCRTCHEAIHAGKTRHEWKDKLESRVR